MADDDPEHPTIPQMASQKGVYQQSQATPEVPPDHRVPLQGAAPVRPARSRPSGGIPRVGQQQQPGQEANAGVISLPVGSRGPRSLYLRRDGDSFGFTLRHFIVYPPDSITQAQDGRHALVGALREPMETIFVKQVYPDSAASRAGLHHGDRLVAVNGVSLAGKSYQQVVQLIQQSPPYLHLLVVPKEDDVLQKFFPEKAHNPETNQRPKRFASPENYSPRRQSAEILKYRPIGTSSQTQRPTDTISWRSYEEPSYSSPKRSSNRDSRLSEQLRDSRSTEGVYCDPRRLEYSDKIYSEVRSQIYSDQRQLNRELKEIYSDPRLINREVTKTEGLNQNRDIYFDPRSNQTNRQLRGDKIEGVYSDSRSRDAESIYSKEGTYYEPKSLRSDSIYSDPNLPKPDNYPTSSNRDSYHETKSSKSEQLYSDPNRESNPTYGRDIIYSDPKDLIYRPIKIRSDQIYSEPITHDLSNRPRAQPQVPRKMGRRASEGSNSCDSLSADYSDMVVKGKMSGSKVAYLDAHTQFEGLQNYGGCRLSLDGRRESTASLNSSLADGSKDSLSSYDSASTLTGQDTDDSIIMTRFRKTIEKKEEFLKQPTQPISWKSLDDKKVPVIQREFYGRPQKLQKEWPPNDPCLNGQDSPKKPTHQNFQRVKIDIDSERDYMQQNGKEQQCSNRRGSADNQQTQFVVGGLVSNSPLQRNSNIRQSKDKNSFVTTLSRIHETNNTENNDHVYLNGSNSLPTDPDERRYPPNLQIVSRRTRQFESGRPVPEDEDETLSDRTNFYRSEISRLSNKRVVPNVAVRKREFETLEIENNKDYRRERDRRQQRESRSLDHSDVPLENDLQVQLRARSNSAESWSAAMQNTNSARHKSIDWHATALENEERHRNRVMRQDSYITALKSKIPDQDRKKQSVVHEEEMDTCPHPESSTLHPEPLPEPVNPCMQQNPVVSVTPASPAIKANRPTQLNIVSPVRPSGFDFTTLTQSPVPGDIPQVVRRVKNNTNTNGDEDRATRRVSYLKATWGDRMHIESDLDLSDTEISPHVLRSRSASADGSGSLSSPERENGPITKEGPLACKFMELDGKRANDRSWHKVWAVLKGPQLHLFKDRHHHHHNQSPMGLVATDHQLQGGVDMRYSTVDVADDYTKRKNVLRISSALPCRNELLLQADSPIEMADWLRTLSEQNGASTESEEKAYSEDKQAQPQQIPANTSIQVQGTVRLSPQPSTKSKLTNSRNRSPTGQSPKSKTWRGRVVKQFKKLNQGSGSPSSPTTPEKLTFGVPLENCPKSDTYEYVPKFVEMCTEIIEQRGLETVGIYRVPGNSAAVSALTEELNKGINITLQDARCDTNVVSSLLKSFFRKLPDSLLTSELYPRFIDADKIEDPKARLQEIKNIVADLPPHQYETLKHLILHLRKVVDNSEVNKMEARNLAIMFGPTLVRNVEDNMVTMVTDMSHQCRIVESLLLYAEWFFSEDEDLNLNTTNQDSGSGKMDNTSATVNNTLLLGNISKIEGIKENTTRENTKKVVSSIISAANRKIQRKPRKSVEQNSNTKEEVTTPTNETKDNTVSLSPHHSTEEQKQVTPVDSEESSSNSSEPTFLTYPQRDAKHLERIEKFKQETMAMLQKKRRTTDMAWDNVPPRATIELHVDDSEETESTNGSDLLATMTSMFDNKIKALQSPINSLTAENIPYADESPDVQLYDTTYESLKPLRESQKCNELKESPKSFRDPSLHKSNSASNFSAKLQNLSEKKKGYDTTDHIEKDVDETLENETRSRVRDELNELCKNNFSSFLSNKELKCSASDSKLKRSESLNKPNNQENDPEHGKLKRSVSLNRAADRLRRSDSLTKYEKTESNINLRRELDTNRRFKKVTKLKRKNGMPERSIKRRHTVGGTKDFDKLHWLDNKLRYEAEEAYREKEKTALRSSSPDLSSGDKLPLESHI